MGMSKMATIFNGCSPEEIENGKQFWKSIDELHVRKSTLSSNSIPEIGQKLASQPFGTDSGKSINSALFGGEENPKYKIFSTEAQRRKEEEDNETYAQYEKMKKETQNRLNEQRQERIQKEMISKKVMNTEYDSLAEA